MYFSKTNSQHLCLLSCPVSPVDEFATYSSESFGPPWEAEMSVVLRSSLGFCRQHQHCWSWDYRAQQLCYLWSAFETKIISCCSPKALENQVDGLVSWFLVSSQSFLTLEWSLAWAEMVPNPSQWGWAWLEGLFGQFSHHVGALLEPFLCAGSGMWDVGQVTNWHWSWLPAVSSLPYPPEPPAVGRVGPQKPLKRGELFLLCRTQDFLNPWEKPSFSHPVSYPALLPPSVSSRFLMFHTLHSSVKHHLIILPLFLSCITGIWILHFHSSPTQPNTSSHCYVLWDELKK